MAAAFFNQRVDPQKARAISAGTKPAKSVHPIVIQVMAERGIDLSSAIPIHLTVELSSDAHLLVTMGCGEECPYVAGLRREDWSLTDPKGKPIDEVRMIRDEVQNLVGDLLDREGWI